MADIDQIIAGGAGSSSRADFSGLPKILDSYYKGRDEFAKNDLRDAFKGGVPTNPDGSIDYASMQRTLYQKGGLEQGNAYIGAGVREGELKLMNGSPQGAAPSQPIVGPSTSRNSVTIDPSKRADSGTGQPAQAQPQAPQQPAQQPTVMTVLAQHVPNDQLGAASASVARQLGVDPTAPLDMKDPRVRNVLIPAIQQLKRNGIGQVQPSQPGDNPPPRTAQPIQVAPQDDAELKKWTFLASSQDKQIAAAAKVRLEALQQDRKLTDDQKNAAAAGVSLTDYQNRADENTTQRDILTKSIIPRIDKSQETATAARDDIDAIHRARGELDQKGGVFSGAFADKKLYLAKAAELLGIPNADKIQNTEAYGAAIGSRVASMVKAFGSGTAISDGDRRFAAAMAGGQVTLDEKSMRRILEIGETAARGKIKYHNEFVEKAVKANEGLKPTRDSFIVQAPGSYKAPEVTAPSRAASTSGTAQAATMVSSKADYDKLPKGASFTGPDGKSWRKP